MKKRKSLQEPWKFLKKTILATATFILPRQVLGKGFQSPSSIARIGIRGMGAANLPNLASTENIVTLFADFLTEIMLLGVVALRKLGQKLQWNSTQMQFSNASSLLPYLTHTYRARYLL